MNGHEILSTIFDKEMYNSIIDFARSISRVTADVFVVMSRKAACFIRFMERHGIVSLDGDVVTDRILDIDLNFFQDKRIVIIDDVIVSGTTIHSIIRKLNEITTVSIQVYVLGVNEKYYCQDLFTYTDDDGILHNYMQSPYLSLSDAACMRVCSNIVSTFALDLAPYDVDFPKHNHITISKSRFTQLLTSSSWLSYDVSTELQSQNNILNITLLPTPHSTSCFDQTLGFGVEKLGTFKIRLFVQQHKKRDYTINAVPYFLFSAVYASEINELFSAWFPSEICNSVPDIAKVRILQYVLAEKLFLHWADSVQHIVSPHSWIIDKAAFYSIFPRYLYQTVESVILSKASPITGSFISTQRPQPVYAPIPFHSSLSPSDEQVDNIAVLQTKLIEPFTKLYFEKELNSRDLVSKYGRRAFSAPEFKETIERLKHGYSYQMLIDILKEYPNIYDKATTVSLFLDEAIDAGFVVPIVAEEPTESHEKCYFRAYRHGEDVPFGELQEKLCSVMLTNYARIGGTEILSKLRVEKMLVLLIRIGLKQNIFTPKPYENIYYNVNIDAYLHGSITTAQDTTSRRSYHYLTHRTDARWLTEVLSDKGIIVTNGTQITSINDHIKIDLDKDTEAKVRAIGQTFAMLYKNKGKPSAPCLTDNDLILLSTCMLPQDILNALAAELSIFANRWSESFSYIKHLLIENPNDIIAYITKGDLYTSINSGQTKFFNCIEKKAQKLVQRISTMLNQDDELYSFANHWDQFWSDNINWTMNSIDSQLRNTIISQGKYLVLLNYLCRVLFVCATDDPLSANHQRWIAQVDTYYHKLQSPVFSRHADIAEYLKETKEIQQKHSSAINKCQEIMRLISRILSYVKPLLSDVELLVDRHGKPCNITRYLHVIHFALDETTNPSVTTAFLDILTSKKIIYKVFSEQPENRMLPEPGVWVFLKNGQFTDIVQAVEAFVSKPQIHRTVQYTRVFVNLSESLRLKTASVFNTRIQFGRFREYANSCRVSTSNDPCTIYWIYENSRTNLNLMDKLTVDKKNNLQTINHSMIKYDTTVSNESILLCTRTLTLIERFRKEYKNMSNKCKIFISYSEDSTDHVDKIRMIARRLERENFEVYFFEEAPLGTDMVDFMRNISTSDITLIIGSPNYRNKASNQPRSGVSFEDRIISDVFMSNCREKIIPIAFGTFDDCFPTPYNKLKGMKINGPTAEELDILTCALIRRYKRSINHTSE